MCTLHILLWYKLAVAYLVLLMLSTQISFWGGGGAFAHVHFGPCSIYDDKLQSPAQEAVVQLGLAASLDLLRDSSFTKGQKKYIK